MKNLSCGILVFVCVASAGAVANAASSTAVFNFGFDDTSLQGQEQGSQADQQKRLQALDGQLQETLVKSGCCRLVELAPVAKQASALDAWNCNGCELDLARKVGAKISVTGWVQKVSNLILNINLVARDVTTGQVIGAGSVDIRGNTDQSWSRGLSYLLRNRLHPATWK
jgi:hypothetical protein